MDGKDFEKFYSSPKEKVYKVFIVPRMVEKYIRESIGHLRTVLLFRKCFVEIWRKKREVYVNYGWDFSTPVTYHFGREYTLSELQRMVL